MSADREQFLADILIGAIEGGTGYWASVSRYKHDCPPGETHATIHDLEDDEKPYEVTPRVVAHGLQVILEPDSSINNQLRAIIREANATNDAGGQFDSECADVVVQAGLFGKVIYG